MVEPLSSEVDQLILSESESCETELHAHKESDERLENEDISPISSPTPRDTRQSSVLPEDAEPHHSSNDNPSDEEGDEDEFKDHEEDFEETLIQPRTLNEVTSVTDRTSPWTSLLSDPDMGSLESLELAEHHAQNNAYHAQDEETNRKLSPEVYPPSLTAQSQDIDYDSDDCERSEAGSDLDACRREDHREKRQSPCLDRVCSLSSISEVEGYMSEAEESDERPDVPSATVSSAELDDESDERTAKRYAYKFICHKTDLSFF